MAPESLRILLIEDDTDIGLSLSQGLELEGYDTTWKTSGADGITHAQRQPPHLVILDVQLPDRSGFDVCRQMRQLKLRQPILMLTVRRNEADKVLGLEMGADDYLTKPYSLTELLARVRALLRRAYGELAEVDDRLTHVADLTIDRDRAQVRRGTMVINLTPTEFRLLAYLAQHMGQAMSRSMIVDAVWGLDADAADERNVNVHVRRLREKVEADPSHPALILTVHGIGYRLVG
jgi:DNA-binding response OmpR family regulator